MNYNKRKYTHQVIQNTKKLSKAVHDITPQVYAAIALAMHRRYGWGFNGISKVFAESQAIWEECTANNDDMLAMCERETGIDVRMR